MAGLGFRHSAGFGKRMEYWLIGQMLKEGLGRLRAAGGRQPPSMR